MASEINSLAHQLERLANKNRRYRDFTLNSLVRAIREVIACLPVYRTYLTSPGSVLPRDAGLRRAGGRGGEAAQRPRRRADLRLPPGHAALAELRTIPPEDRPGVVAFVRRFQQVTGPVTAKGVEDTAFYVYNRLVSLNEVGGEPESFGLSLSGIPPPQRRPAAALAARHARHLDPRHQAERGRPGPDRRPVGNPRGMAGRAVTVEPDQHGPQEHRRRRTGAGPQRRVPVLPGAARGLAVRPVAGGVRRLPRAGDQLHAQGDQGSRGPHQLGQPERRVRGGDAEFRHAGADRRSGRSVPPGLRGACNGGSRSSAR